jgi:hypothetical protein
MPGSADRFEIHYANGKIDLATSLEDAERKVVHEASDERIRGLLPATILMRHPSGVIGRGETVRAVTAEDIEEAISPATVMHAALTLWRVLSDAKPVACPRVCE